MTKEEFARQAYAAALQSSERSGMPAMVTVAQASLESNWGQSKLSQEANNYFGIKAHGTHARIQMPTEECEKGTRVSVEAEFAKYLSMLDCF
jgi:flagellum-specific peptidoglycan hydrolase FlgJ